MTETAKVPRNTEGGRPGRRPLVDDELADQRVWARVRPRARNWSVLMGCCPG